MSLPGKSPRRRYSIVSGCGVPGVGVKVGVQVGETEGEAVCVCAVVGEARGDAVRVGDPAVAEEWPFRGTTPDWTLRESSSPLSGCRDGAAPALQADSSKTNPVKMVRQTLRFMLGL